MGISDDKAKAREEARLRDGTFGEQHLPEPASLLGAPTPAQTYGLRAMDLAGGGHVDAVTYQAVGRPDVADELRAEWWDTARVAAEYAADGRGYPQMPDDYTPSMTAGQALSGHRRTHRMAYRGSGMTLRMPSATSVRAFARNESSTFDVPITAEYRRDDGSTGSVTGWVRVTRFSDREWSTTPIGFKGDTGAPYAEAVAAVLEARRPTAGLREAGDLIEAHRRRVTQGGTTLAPLRSSWIDSMSYDTNTGTMFTQTKKGGLYGHQVPEGVHAAIAHSPRPGEVFNRMRKNRRLNEPVAVASCPRCQRVYSTAVGHHCAGHQAPTGQVWDKTVQARRSAAARLTARVVQMLS